MNKLLLCFVFIIGFTGLNAQITLTGSAHNPQIGDNFTQMIQSNPPSGFNEGPQGAGVTWDFASLTHASTGDVVIQAASSGDFSTSDIFYSQSGTQSYFKTSEGNFTFMGFVSSFSTVNYTDGEDQVRFPMNYGDTYSDNASGTVSGFMQADRDVTLEVTADAYGTLITPEETYTNAMRVQIIRNTTDTDNGTPVGTSTDSIYYWYTADVRFPVMTYFKSYSEGSFSGSSVNWLKSSSASQEKYLLETVDIYPNPASKFLNINGIEADNYQFHVTDNTGKTIPVSTENQRISLESLSTGNYILQISDKKGRTAEFSFIKH